MPYWEIVADNPKKRGWTYGYVSTVDSQGRTIWIVAAYRLKSIAARQSLNNHFSPTAGSIPARCILIFIVAERLLVWNRSENLNQSRMAGGNYMAIQCFISRDNAIC